MDIDVDLVVLENLLVAEGIAIDALLELGVISGPLLRLKGGARNEIVEYQGGNRIVVTPEQAQIAADSLINTANYAISFYKKHKSSVDDLGRRARLGYDRTLAYFRRRRTAQENPDIDNDIPMLDAPQNGSTSAGASMLSWKNSLTRMYHTYQTYVMSPILQTTEVASWFVHRTSVGIGPHLYSTYDYKKNNTGETVRNQYFGTVYYWEGGMYGNPTPQTTSPTFIPAKNFGLGRTSTIYIFSADWPGTIMNTDTETQNSGSSYKYLCWKDTTYSGTVTTPNYPRTWVSVFANTNWQYLTIYGTQFRFDVTNVSMQDYIFEISLFKFKADIDAMDYEKQCLAHVGGYHQFFNAYIQNLNAMPIADVNIVRTKRYRIKGCKTNVGTWNLVEGTVSNNRTIKWNIKRKYVLKRPLLNSYETNLSEQDIFAKYYEAQKGLYFRLSAWPTDLLTLADINGTTTVPDGYGSANPNIPATDDNTTTPTRMGNGLQVNMYKKSYFKLDENTTTF